MTSSSVRRTCAAALLAAGVLGAFAVGSVIGSSPATAASVTVVTGAGSGATDPNFTVTPPAGSAVPATVITTAPSGWTATVTGARWVGIAAAPTADPTGSYVFEASVVVPAGAALSGSVASVDAVAIALVQGATTTTIPGAFGSSATTPTPVAFAGPITAGTYTVRVTVNHTNAATAVGLLGSLTFSDASSTEPAATEYHALAVPIRVYDSRSGTGPAATGEGVLASGLSRTVSLANGYPSQGATVRVPAVPAGAASAMINLTIDGTVNTGFLSAYASGATQPATSSINWFGSNQILANLNVVAVAADGSIKITAGGGGSTHVVVDVLGYFRTPTT